MDRCRNWKELLEETGKAGFKSLELNVEVPEKWFPEIIASVEKGEIQISSLHNFCPKLENLPPGKNIYNAYMLTAANEEERQAAVEYTLKTIEWASRVGAKAVVIHAGDIDTNPSGREVFKYADQFGVKGKLLGKYISSLMEDRKGKAGRPLESLMRSFDDILKAADAANIVIGLENRVYLHEIPNIEESLMILDNFKGGPIGHWHDTGHAEIFVRMGVVESHKNYMEALGGRIVGLHLHDVKKVSDHYAPGRSDLDFAMIAPYIPKNALRVIEAHPKSSVSEIRCSIDYLKKIGIE